MSLPSRDAPPAYHDAAAGPPDYTQWVPANRLQRFQQLCSDHEISNMFASRLRVLEGFDIVLVCDDSGSMRAPVELPNAQSAFAPTVTRWDELKRSVATVASIAACLDDDGIDIHFLNRPSLYAVKETGAIDAAFAPPPTGFTPIAATLSRILVERGARRSEKQLLLVVFTDGEPTDTNGAVDIAGLEYLLRQRPTNVYTTLVACTSDEQAVAYMNVWDKVIPRVDVCDDYQSEKREILQARGSNFRFSHGDYCVKLLLGSIDAQMDRLDEKSPTANRAANSQASQSSCCVIA